MSAQAAADERWFSDRHRMWPRHLYVYDDDGAQAFGQRVAVETTGGVLGACKFEDKSVNAGPLDLGEMQFRSLATACRPEVPFFVRQFTCPPVTPFLAVRLHANNRMASSILDGRPRVLSEQDFVLFLEILVGKSGRAGRVRRATTATLTTQVNGYAGPCMNCGALVAEKTGWLVLVSGGRKLPVHSDCHRDSDWQWSEPSHLSSLACETPDESFWPEVRWRGGDWELPPPRLMVEQAKSFLDWVEESRSPDEVWRPESSASVTALIANRPTIGAIKGTANATPTSDDIRQLAKEEAVRILAEQRAASMRGRRKAHATFAIQRASELMFSDDPLAYENLSGGREVWANRYEGR